jgi:thiol-disulfide isomerase/thioredoxin
MDSLLGCTACFQTHLACTLDASWLNGNFEKRDLGHTLESRELITLSQWRHCWMIVIATIKQPAITKLLFYSQPQHGLHSYGRAENLGSHRTFGLLHPRYRIIPNRAKVNSSQIVVIDFTATWCGPCRVISPIFDKLSEQDAHSAVKFYKVDVDTWSDISQAAGVRAVSN